MKIVGNGKENIGLSRGYIRARWLLEVQGQDVVLRYYPVQSAGTGRWGLAGGEGCHLVLEDPQTFFSYLFLIRTLPLFAWVVSIVLMWLHKCIATKDSNLPWIFQGSIKYNTCNILVIFTNMIVIIFDMKVNWWNQYLTLCLQNKFWAT